MRLLRHTALAALTLAGLPALTVPVTAGAQDSAATTGVPARSHTVRRGDTLWDLSRAYMGDPFLWPELYRINTAVVEDPHWIYPGERLALPDAVAVAADAEPDEEEQPAGPIFASTVRTRSPLAPERLEPLGRGRFAAVRPGEIYAAPFVDREGGPAGAGRIEQHVAPSSIRADRRDQALLINDEVYVTLPRGSAPAVGGRYLTYTLGKRIDDVGQLIVPTGILRVESAESGTTPRARIIQQFGRVLAGQQLLALGAEAPPPDAAPSAVESAPSATVVWIPDEPVLASLQQYVVLDASARKGTRVGDEFTLVRPRRANPGSLPLPEEPIAVAQVVRVTPYAATAVVVSQDHPAIQRGTRARVSAKMP